MNEQSAATVSQKNREREFLEIDLVRLWKAIVKKIWLVGLVTAIGAVLAFLITAFFITPQYQSSSLFYVNNNALSLGDASVSIDAGDITASKSLVDSYIVILNSRSTLNDVIDYAGVDYTYKELQEMISASDVNSTEIFQVVVTSPSAQEAEVIANAIAQILPKRISSIVEGSSAKVVDYAVVATRPSSPSYVRNVLLGFVIGFVLSVGTIVLVEIFDITLKEEEDVIRSCDYPLLASVPDMTAVTKGGYYGYGQRKPKAKTPTQQPPVVGSGINFAASEAYKLLRTKLQYSFTDDKKCRIITVSSAMAGEGKSVSSVNLANTLAQFNERVLLIDCDMRRPTMAEKLSLKKTPGLSDYLTGTMDVNDIFQRYSCDQENNLFYVISAGPNPPNPVELLSSAKMENLLKRLRGLFDYIILDMPPIGEVSDALVTSKLADGVLLVVRQNYCNTLALKDALQQFEFVNSRILGVVVNCSTENSKKKYSKYNHYSGERYGRLPKKSAAKAQKK